MSRTGILLNTVQKKKRKEKTLCEAEKGQLHFFQRHACCLAMLRNSEFDRRVVPGYGCLDWSEQTHFVEV